MNNVVNENFLLPETRCDYYVSAETKACWKAMLDMVEQLDRVCRKYNIKYFLIAGSLLGAVRHKGFIPWDDDIDIALFREDYDRLEKILPGELPLNMFMQTTLTDPGYETAHMKIRLAGTTAILRGAINMHRRYNMGLFVDVFALDGVPKTKFGKFLLTMIGRGFRSFVSYHSAGVRSTRLRGKLKRAVHDLIWRIVGTKNIYRLREWCFAMVDIRAGGDCVQAPCEWGYEQKYRYPVELLEDTVDMPFEYLTLKVPARYEEVLTHTYGDWRKIVKGGSAHTIVAMSATESYKEKLIDAYGYSEQELEILS